MPRTPYGQAGPSSEGNSHADGSESLVSSPSLSVTIGPTPGRIAAPPALGAARTRPFEVSESETLSCSAGPGESDKTPLDALTDILVRAMSEAWAQGDKPRVEDVLGLCPELAAQDQAIARLVEREILLRRERGEPDPTTELARRFPAWAARVAGRGRATPGDPGIEPPSPGEPLGEFRLKAEIGRGCRGSVFLATQPALADRPVVLKITSPDGGEHLALARLQHPHIVPLHGLHDHPDRGLRVLCMPYLGGASLSRLLDMLRFVAPAERTGADLLRALESAEAAGPAIAPSEGPARRFLAHADYDRAVCWIGSCLADALDAAHRRGLLHLDLKPSNVLIAADGRPMLLDFHLARGPIRAGSPAGHGLGGTPSYMAPEQRAAFEAVREARPIPVDVDGRADVFALGLILHEALGGPLPRDRAEQPHPLRSYPGADAGFAAIVAKCLAPDPADRYPDAASLAADLRRQLADQPLRGVDAPGLADRWRKWRRRRPHALAKVVLLVAALAGTAAAVAAAAVAIRGRLAVSARALASARAAIDRRDFGAAAREAEYGRARLPALPFADRSRRELEQALEIARRGVQVQDLRELADGARRLDVAVAPSRSDLVTLARRASEAWATRVPLLEAGSALPPGLSEQVRDDLIDVVVALGAVEVRLARPGDEVEVRRSALRRLDEAEVSLGPNAVLERERDIVARALGLPTRPRLGVSTALTPRGHAALGRSLLRGGELQAALAEFDRALELDPRDLWAHFYRGVCASRLGDHEDAAEAFGACLALDPVRAEFAFNRALALAALGDDAHAVRDYDRALRLDPTWAAAALNRGIVHFRASRLEAARADFRRALDLGADPAEVHFNMALVERADGRPGDALAHLRLSLGHNPVLAPAADLARRLAEESPTQ